MEVERRKRSQSLEYESQYRIDRTTGFLSLLLALECVYGWTFYYGSQQVVRPPAIQHMLLQLAIGSSVKTLFCGIYSFYCKHGGWFLLSTGTYFAYVFLLIQAAILIDSFPHEPFSNMHLTMPLIWTTFEYLVFYQVFSSHQAYTSHLSPMEEGRAEIKWQTLLVLMKPYFWPKGANNRIRAVSTYCILGISKVANLSAPLYMAKATNALTSGDVGSARTAIAVYCCLVLISSLFKELQKIVYLRVKQTAYIEIARLTYAHVHSLSLDWHLRKKMGDVLRSMDRGVESANQVVSYLFLYLFPTVIEAIVVIFIFSMHFNLALLSVIGFLSLVLYTIVTTKITMWRKKFKEAMNKHDNEFHDRATDCLINFETVKYFTNEQYEVERYSKAVGKYQNQSTMTQASLGMLNSSQQVIIQATVFGALAVSVPHIIHQDHQLNIGSFVAISVYLANLFTPLSFLGTIYNMIIKAYVDMVKLSDLLVVKPDVTDLPGATELPLSAHTGVSIAFDSVSFHYPTQAASTGLRNVSFVVAPNTTTALVGTTGSGKTTISRLLFRFYNIEQGAICINGENIATVTQKSLRHAIGIVPQDTVLFNDSILENLKYGKLEATMAQVVQAAKDAQIYDRIMTFPEQWDTKVGERGLKLSGGEKQRIAIARTLLKNPPIVVLDEATSALDSGTEKEIQKSLNSLRNDRTMLVIAHRLSTIRNAEQILVLQQGEIVERGTHDSLLALNGEYQRLWAMQLEDINDSK